MKVFIKLLVVFSFLPTVSLANDFGFTNIDASDADNLFEEFAATMSHTTITGAKSKSKIFGFEFGITGGLTQADDISDLVEEALPGQGEEVKDLPFASLYGLVSFAGGITGEINFFPEVDVQGVKFNHLSLGGKFEITQYLKLPFSLAVRAFLVRSSLSIEQSSPFSSTVEIDQTQIGLHGIISKKIGPIEPYAAIGLAQAKGDIKAMGSAGTFFDTTFTASEEVEVKASGLYTAVGVQASLLIIKPGLEWVTMFGVSRYNLKLALSF